MATNTNKVILTGRLAQDPEVRYTKTGKPVASMTLAVGRPSFQGQEDTADFIPLVAWEKLAEVCGNNLSKGRKILVEGRLQIRSYETADGQKRRIAEVIVTYVEFLDYADRGAGNNSQHSNSQRADFGVFGRDVIDEEIPF